MKKPVKNSKILPTNPMEGTIYCLVDNLNELIVQGMDSENEKERDAILIRCVQLFHVIDALCDYFKVDMPSEGVEANIMLDDHFGKNILEDSIIAYATLVTQLLS